MCFIKHSMIVRKLWKFDVKITMDSVDFVYIKTVVILSFRLLPFCHGNILPKFVITFFNMDFSISA